MAQFYKELKDLRESRGISLEEISERTKINISYLNAIESGSFSEIETPYLRLFLRAYAEEIGGDSQRSLEQLDSFLGTNRPKVVSSQMNDDDEDELETDYSQSFSFSGKRLRQDYIIGGVLSLVLLFAIAIFQKIFDEESNAIITNEGPRMQNLTKPIFWSDLQKNFILDQTSEELLPITPPLFLKIKTLAQTAYTYTRDSMPPVSKSIKPNQEIDLEALKQFRANFFTHHGRNHFC
ncbi:MAG: hypothetical protein CM15mP87_07900 [Candidatus Neomarinimicrobiota bacterium]|nr:MAG: hypothetical protein CM15mP87_07900 [Candidatus Neomarinimicrobiota bacterium]